MVHTIRHTNSLFRATLDKKKGGVACNARRSQRLA